MPQPQTHNNGEWKKIEDHIRTKFDKKTVKYVETGPIFDDNVKTEKLNGFLPIPKGIYKKGETMIEYSTRCDHCSLDEHFYLIKVLLAHMGCLIR